MTFAIEFDNNGGAATYKQLARALKRQILSGRLKPGEKMPSIRDLAASANVSAATVNRCYQELTSQHFIDMVPGSGTFISKRLPEVSESNRQIDFSCPTTMGEMRLSTYSKRVMSEEFVEQSPQLHSGAPLIEDLPISRWKEMLSKAKKFEDNSLLEYESDPLGYWPLRQAVAGYLSRSRSVKCSPHQIVIFPQVEGGTDLIGRLLLEEGDAVALEDPCYPARLRGFRLHGAKIVSIPVDKNGMKIDHLSESDETIRLVHVTPSHHDPSGAQLSMDRRHQLLAWSEANDAFILENDYDSEYQYDQSYMPAIQGLDKHDRVIYRYTFWRVMYPLVRMSLLVVPARLLPLVKRAKQYIGGESPLLEQKVLADFIEQGYLEKHIQRTRASYQTRRAHLIHALTRNFGRLEYSTAGMHLLAQFPLVFSPEDILRIANECGVNISETKGYYTEATPRQNEFMLGFAYYSSSELMESAIESFAQKLKSLPTQIGIPQPPQAQPQPSRVPGAPQQSRISYFASR